MEDYQKKKLGAGILTVSIIQLIGYIFGICSTILGILALSTDILPTEFCEGFKSATNGVVSITSLYIGLVFYLIFIISLILVFCKKALGVYLFFLAVVINYIYTIIMSGFSPFGLISLILPLLTAIFVYRKRYVFNIGAQCAND